MVLNGALMPLWEELLIINEALAPHSKALVPQRMTFMLHREVIVSHFCIFVLC